MKKKFLTEEVERARLNWQAENPDLMAETAPKKAKSTPKNAQTPQTEIEHVEENFPFIRSLTAEEIAANEYRNKIMKFAAYIHEKCETFVRRRNLEEARLTFEESELFRRIILGAYRSQTPNYSLIGVAEAMLIDGLRYPDKSINDFCVGFIKRQQCEAGVSWSLWMSLWCQPFVPADAVRLMMYCEDEGEYYRNNQFAELVPLLAKKIRWHLNAEYARLAKAQQLEDETVRRREVARKSRRILLFRTLLSVYDIAPESDKNPL